MSDGGNSFASCSSPCQAGSSGGAAGQLNVPNGVATDTTDSSTADGENDPGGAWSTGIEASLPATAGYEASAYVNSVSCASAGDCTAVGWYHEISGTIHGLLLSESGGTWSTGIEAPLPANASATLGPDLVSVSCASAGDCTAVGHYYDTSGNEHGLLLSESGGTWSTGIEAPLPANASASLRSYVDSVSCASAGDCTAVGWYRDTSGNEHGLLLSESGGTWSTGIEASLPANAGELPYVAIRSVSCPSAGDCAAVGMYYDTSVNPHGLLLSESGGTWSTGIEAPLPANVGEHPSAYVNSVSCASGGCTAVGYYADTSGTEHGLLLSESGGTWSTGIEAPLPANAGEHSRVEIESVSCASAGDCTAVGYYADTSGNLHGLLLSESGGTWSTGIEAPVPANANANLIPSLDSVSCASAGDCTAVGHYYVTSGNDTHGLLLSESGGTWSTGIDAPLPSNANASPTTASLDSVSCASAGRCTAVGGYHDTSGNTQGLLVSESGSTGIEAPAPPPPAPTGGGGAGGGSLPCPATQPGTPTLDNLAAQICRFAKDEAVIAQEQGPLLNVAAGFPDVHHVGGRDWAGPIVGLMPDAKAAIAEGTADLIKDAVEDQAQDVGDALGEKLGLAAFGCTASTVPAVSLFKAGQADAAAAGDEKKAADELALALHGSRAAGSYEIGGHIALAAKSIIDKIKALTDDLEKLQNACEQTREAPVASAFQTEIELVIVSLSSDVTTITSDYNAARFMPLGGWLLLPLQFGNNGLVVVDPPDFPLNPALNPWGLPPGARVVSPPLRGLTLGNTTQVGAGYRVITGSEPIRLPVTACCFASSPPVNVYLGPVVGSALVSSGAGGYASSASAAVALGSRPERLAVIRARHNGHFSVTVRIAHRTKPGKYELYAVGKAPNGHPRVLGASIIVSHRHCKPRHGHNASAARQTKCPRK